MRTAYVCADPGVPVFGTKGASVHVQAVVRELRRRDHEVHLFATRWGDHVPDDLAGVPTHRLPVPTGAPAERERAGLHADVGCFAALIDHGPFDLVYERYSLWSRAGTAYARRVGVPGVLEVNAPLIDEQADHRSLVDRAEAEQVATDAMGAASVVVAVSEAVGRWALAHGAERAHTIPNGVDVARFSRSSECPPGPFTVGFVGTLRPWHGVETLVDAVAGLDEHTRLLLVGGGSLVDELRERPSARTLGDRLRITGSVAPGQVPDLLAGVHVAVAPYPDLADCYFSPLKLYEYLAAGRAVVASAVGQVPDVIDHDSNGVLVEPGSVDALRRALADLRDDRDRRARLGAEARRRARAHHGWDHVIDRILALAGQHLPAGTAP